MKLLSRRRSRPVAEEPAADPRLVMQAAALVLAYPDEDLLGSLDTIEDALVGTKTHEQFQPVLTHLRQGRPGEDGDPRSLLARLQAFHVAEFDLSRKHALHLSYWTDGDTRRRGASLVELQQAYRDSAFDVDLAGELPDYLPVMLEFAAASPDGGLELLQRFRASLELIRLALVADDLPHAGVLAAVCDCLPGENAQTRAEVQARFGDAQPIEFVGLSESARS
ncbi:MAG TPA: nitrate reductase molybdenum cofactor assembly chaperone [Propionibacteriaceae bacterium]|nr:nitrate reductase molybdenum cofactor assembly chaperone [Propionibacteriaceae bacterium]